MIDAEIREPLGLGWVSLGRIHLNECEAYAYYHEPTATQVLSAVHIAELPVSKTPGPQWMVSVVNRSAQVPSRPTAAQVRLMQCAFDMFAAEEDNHHPGSARQFWLPVDPAERVDCECKSTEVVHREADGYAWTNPSADSGEACRGCEQEATFRALAHQGFEGAAQRPCPIHTSG